MSSKHPRPNRPSPPAPRSQQEPAPTSREGWRTANTNLTVTQETTIEHVWQGDVPSPQDMRAFQQVDERFPTFFMDRVTVEQNWRHGRVDRVDKVQTRLLYSREGRAWARLVAGTLFLAGCMAFSYAAFLKEVYVLAAALFSPPLLVTARHLLASRKDDESAAPRPPGRTNR